MSIITIDRIRERLDAHSPTVPEIKPHTRRAAVSVLLDPKPDHTQALFILRAKKDGDPWSGHMAFPGGHHEDHDESLQHTAVRETYEEIGVDLTEVSECIGQLDSVQANPRGGTLDMVVTPFVFELKKPITKFEPNYEVADVLWGSLNDMHNGESRTVGQFRIADEMMSYNGYSVGGEIVWGLTYRMLDHLFSTLDPDWVEQ